MGNLEIREFSQAIINFVNQSLLPVEVKRLALSDILSQIEDVAENAVKTELEERVRKEKLKKKEGEAEDVTTEQAVQQN